MEHSLRHGDFTFFPYTGKIEGEKIEMRDNKFTFAEGEATGHLHTLHVPSLDDMEWYKLPDGGYIVRLHTQGYATHPEHSIKTDLVVPPGMYTVKQRREKDWFSLIVRQVID